MSDQTQTAEASPTAERPSQFAVNIGNLLTKGNPEQSIGVALDALVAQRVDWENNELASANDALYALLPQQRHVRHRGGIQGSEKRLIKLH